MTARGLRRIVKPDFVDRDPSPLLAAIQGGSAGEIEIRHRLTGGAWGAWLVQRRGTMAVLKCIWDVDWRPRIRLAADVVERIRERDDRVPRFMDYGYLADHGTWLLQEFIAGAPIPQLTPDLLTDVLALGRNAAGLFPARRAAGFDWSDEVRAVVAPDSPDLALLRRSGLAAARLADAAEGAGGSAATLASHDAVHGDFLVTQLLVDEANPNRLVGVIDWDQTGPGSRAIDLALLLQNVEVQGDRTGVRAERRVIDGIVQAGVEAAGSGFVSAVHYHLVKMVGFVLANNPRHVEWRLDVAGRVLRTVQLAMGT